MQIFINTHLNTFFYLFKYIFIFLQFSSKNYFSINERKCKNFVYIPQLGSLFCMLFIYIYIILIIYDQKKNILILFFPFILLHILFLFILDFIHTTKFC